MGVGESLQPWIEQVRPEWIDYNEHLSEAYYVLVFGHATDSVMAQIGMAPEHCRQTGTSLFTVEAHLRYLDQVAAGATLQVRPRVIGCTGKLLWIWHELWVEERLRATEEVLGVHVDTTAGGSTPFPAPVLEQLRGLVSAPPPAASRRISLLPASVLHGR